ncbi:ABC transporter ATP-binding protein/permease [Kitasatospora sp. RB6PN24]|uniref:ABC transporter ATP-binding protein n=1 Tax=Kitasatospora humi TaxID=2893891 RepID=UPI001E483B25|nr:ABC transporter ATP-binding protein [Kitasatospora humi]MCC9309155.1 ABC transporter ATP-binding protein/permease [Kitasatospora humi]
MTGGEHTSDEAATTATGEAENEAVSESEELLFGGPMRYSAGWAKHELASGEVSFLSVARQLPGLLRLAGRMAWLADRRAMVVLVGAELLRGAAAGVVLLATSRALRALLGHGDVGQVLRAAIPAIVVAGAVAALSAVLAAASEWASGRLEPAVFRGATSSFLEAVVRSEQEAIEDPEFLAQVDAARWGALSIQRLVGQATAVLSASFSLASAAGVLTVLHPVLLPMLLLICAPRGWGAVRTARRRYASTRAWLQHSRASTALADMLIHPWSAAELRVHAAGAFILHHYEQMSLAAEQEQARLAGAKARTDLAAAALSGLASAGAFVLLGWLVVSGSMALAVAGTAVVAIRSGAASISGLVTQINQLYEQALFVRDLADLQCEGERRAIPAGGVPLPERVGEIRVENLSYTYTGRDEPALDDVSLVLPRGEVVALVGANGSGKSTLAHLLAGVYQPTRGRILWDGTDAGAADRDQLFASVCLLAQNFQRYTLTLRANLLLGRPEVHLEQHQLDASARHAGLDEVIAELPRGWSTMLGKSFERGVSLSGGQWQRVAEARTHLRLTTPGPDGRMPQLVIVDEPTSALDPNAEVAAFGRIRALTELGVTVVLITHRLAATAKADRIYVLDRGKLIEHGTHQDLMSSQPDTTYRQMYLLQAEQYQTDVPHQSTRTNAAGVTTS